MGKFRKISKMDSIENDTDFWISKPFLSPHFHPAGHILWFDSRTLVSTPSQNEIRVIDLETNSVLGTAHCPEEDPIFAITLHRESRVVYTSHKSSLIRTWRGNE